MTPGAWLPGVTDGLALAGLAVTLALFLVLGAAAGGRRLWPELQIAAGWGLTCLVLTLWAVVTPLPSRIPLAGLGLAALGCLARPRLRARISLDGLGRMAVLSLPLWLVTLPMRPSQVDTWLNLLPNAAFLFDHDMLPRADRPPSWSFLPVAPYNTQFAGYIASVVSGAFAANAIGLFNIALLVLAALLLARVLAQTANHAPPWWACAAGLLLALPLNPGFVPRFFFAPYGEPSLAVTALFAVWLAARTLRDMRTGPAAAAPALALILAALVNIKQSGIGLLLPIGAGFLLLASHDRAIPRGRALATAIGILAPALALYGVWRFYAVTSFAVGELRPAPMADWHVSLLPSILWAVVVAISQKPVFFLGVAVIIAAAAWRRGRGPDAALPALIAIAIVLFNGFIVTTYVVLFPPDMAIQAHSFYRYNTQLSLLMVLGLIVLARPRAVSLLERLPGGGRRARQAVTIAALAFPVALAPLFRFDLLPPQPAIWAMGHAIAAELDPRARLALLVPGDQFDATASMLRGVMLFTEPRRPGLDFTTRYEAGAETLRAVAEAGYDLALISCTPAGMAGIPPNVAALLRRTPDGWLPVRIWSWPPGLNKARFAALLARAPLCAGDP